MKIASNRIADPMRQWEALFVVVVVLIGIALSGSSNQTKPEQNGDEALEQSVTTEDETQQPAVPGPVEQASEVEQKAELPPTEEEQLPTIGLEPRQGVMGSLVNYYRPDSQAGKGQILLEVKGNPETVAPGEKTTITVTVHMAKGSPLSDANVTVSAGGGKFLPSAETPFDPKSRLHGPYTATGTTDSQGQFTTWWVCNPCARGYVLGIEASKGGEVSSRTEYTIHIKQ